MFVIKVVISLVDNIEFVEFSSTGVNVMKSLSEKIWGLNEILVILKL